MIDLGEIKKRLTEANEHSLLEESKSVSHSNTLEELKIIEVEDKK
jgi:hypothetical protein